MNALTVNFSDSDSSDNTKKERSSGLTQFFRDQAKHKDVLDFIFYQNGTKKLMVAVNKIMGKMFSGPFLVDVDKKSFTSGMLVHKDWMVVNIPKFILDKAIGRDVTGANSRFKAVVARKGDAQILAISYHGRVHAEDDKKELTLQAKVYYLKEFFKIIKILADLTHSKEVIIGMNSSLELDDLNKKFWKEVNDMDGDGKDDDIELKFLEYDYYKKGQRRERGRYENETECVEGFIVSDGISEVGDVVVCDVDEDILDYPPLRVKVFIQEEVNSGNETDDSEEETASIYHRRRSYAGSRRNSNNPRADTIKSDPETSSRSRRASQSRYEGGRSKSRRRQASASPEDSARHGSRRRGSFREPDRRSNRDSRGGGRNQSKHDSGRRKSYSTNERRNSFKRNSSNRGY